METKPIQSTHSASTQPADLLIISVLRKMGQQFRAGREQSAPRKRLPPRPGPHCRLKPAASRRTGSRLIFSRGEARGLP
jgi:hypothetical protein